MTTENLILLSVPGLRPQDITPELTPTLFEWARGGAMAELTPTFPCVTSPVQASMWTGAPPGEHGVVANGFYHRDRHEVEFWVGRNGVIAGEQIWDVIAAGDPDITSAVWHAQNIKDAAADFIVTPAPIHEPDGTTKLWCYSKPDELYQELLDEIGHFPLQHYWGPMAGIESTQWILRAASLLIDVQAPSLHWIYLPHLDYASQVFGPNDCMTHNALAELDERLAAFAEQVHASTIGEDAVFLVAGEYALTDVSGVVYPNRVLREAGLLTVREEGGHEQVDFVESAAFAVVDHQLAHVYVKDSDPATVARAKEALAGRTGVAGAYAGNERKEIGLDHERAGDIVLVAAHDHWFAYYWWLSNAAAPSYARTVDIHRKPGYDPCELFIDPSTKAISLDATLVKGSHGAPAVEARQRTALICSAATAAVETDKRYRDTDIKRIALELLGISS